jgi:uncharacterized damage-inducible protein DinB
MPDAVITATRRVDPPYIGDERTMLDAWLDFHRETLLMKCEGLDGDQLASRPCPPSTLSLIGLVRHMAEVERGWFRIAWDETVPTDWYEAAIYCTRQFEDGDFDLTDPATAAADVATFRAEVEACRAVAAEHGLDETRDRRRDNGQPREISLRWIYVHMIEEYARHNGHADLLRELVDGVTGD